MSPVLRLGLVGCGRLAELGYLPALAGMSDVHVVAIADPDPTRRSIISTALDGGKVAEFATAAELVGHPDLDGVVIASPVGSHIDDATAAAGAGIVALLEKPPAPDAVTAATLLLLSPTPYLGFNRRFDADARAAREAARSADGLSLTLRLHYRRASWSPHQVRDDALLDLGPHLVDWARWISAGEVTSVQCGELSADRARLDLTLDRGTAHIDVAADRPHQELVEVRGVSGSVLHRHRLGGFVDGVRGRLLRGGRPDALVTTLRAELQAYAHALRTGQAGDLGSPADGVAVMATLDAARASSAAGGAPTPVLPPTAQGR